MKDLLKKPLLWITSAFTASILVLAAFLVIESYFFSTRVRELSALKEDYENNLLALKKLIVSCETLQQSAVDALDKGEKKKSSVETTDSSGQEDFVTVTRDFDCLYRSALHYAAKYNLEQAVDELYQDAAIMNKNISVGSRLSKKITKYKRPFRTKRRARQQLVAIDADAAALKKEHPFVWPLQQGTFWLSSPFGPRKKPNGSWGFHYGLDMAAPKGTPVRSVAHGVVLEAKMAPGYGNTILIVHSAKLKTRYAHLSKIEVRVGDTVEQGEHIGRVGNTGNARGRNGLHLHFEVSVYGKRIDPFYFLREG